MQALGRGDSAGPQAARRGATPDRFAGQANHHPHRQLSPPARIL